MRRSVRGRAVDAIEPELQHAHGRRAGAELLRLEQALQQRRLDDVVVLVDPERLEQMVLVVGVAGVEAVDPRPQRRDDVLRRPLAERPTGAIARAILVGLEQLELRGDRLPVDPRRRR